MKHHWTSLHLCPTQGTLQKILEFYFTSTYVCEQALGYVRASCLEGPRACSSTHSIAVPSGEGVGWDEGATRGNGTTWTPGTGSGHERQCQLSLLLLRLADSWPCASCLTLLLLVFLAGKIECDGQFCSLMLSHNTRAHLPVSANANEQTQELNLLAMLYSESQQSGKTGLGWGRGEVNIHPQIIFLISSWHLL